MKKVKMIFLLVITVALIAGVIIIIQFNRNTVVIERDETVKETLMTFDDESVIQLSAPADSEEEAKEIAEMYGITYRGYYRGYGQYETTEDFNSLKEYGMENNFPTLEVVYKSFTK